MEQAPNDPYQSIQIALGSFTGLLLENATRHTENWRRAAYEVKQEDLSELFALLENSPFGKLLVTPGTPIPYFEGEGEEPIIATSSPASIYVGVEEFDHRPESDWHQTTIDFSLIYPQLDAEGKEVDRAALHLKHVLGSTSLYRNIVMWRYAETGYEGHGFEKYEAAPEDLHYFLRLLSEYAGPLAPEKPFQEWLKGIIYICEDTGVVFRYDDDRGTHVSAEGQTMDEHQSPLYELDQQLDDIAGAPPLREKNRFRVQFPENS